MPGAPNPEPVWTVRKSRQDHLHHHRVTQSGGNRNQSSSVKTGRIIISYKWSIITSIISFKNILYKIGPV